MIASTRSLALLALLAGLVGPGRATAQPKPLVQGSRVEPNVVYGMYSGLALVLDVHRPVTPNGYGVIFISGSGWQSATTYDATPLKQNQVPIWGPSLLQAGYTVFALNHRAVPRFHYPGAVDDVQRAIRFVRHHAKDYQIDPAHIGGMGGSSGGHLIALTALLAAPGLTDDPDPVNREPATLQAIVLRATPTDLIAQAKADHGGGVTGFLELPWSESAAARKLYTTASPSTYVSAKAPPTLLIHGDADESVPFEESVAMEAGLKAAGVPTGLIRVPGGAHGADFGVGSQPRPDWPDFLGLRSVGTTRISRSPETRLFESAMLSATIAKLETVRSLNADRMSANLSVTQPVPLTQLRAGSTARMHSAELTKEDCALLKALGMTDRCLLRVCKAGEPCIVEVKATRIGLSRALARGVFVVPEATA